MARQAGMSYGHQFAVEYLGWSINSRSEAAITIFGDAYLNFGIVGVLIFSILLGLLYRAMYGGIINNRVNVSSSRILIYFFLLKTAISIELNIAAYLAQLLWQFILGMIIVFLISSLLGKKGTANAAW